jgi:hypothetical protein
VLLLLLLTFFSGFARCTAANPQTFPFAPGEKLHYEVYWLGIKAAKATLEVLPMTVMDGKPVWHFAMTAQTTPFVATIYPVSNTINSWAGEDMTRALRYTENKRKRSTTKNVSITFDWEANMAYSVKNGKKRTVELKPGAFDPLSIFYFFRMQELRENLEFSRPVTDRKHCLTTVTRVHGRQTVRSGGQLWDTWLVEPELSQVKNVFEKNPDARLQIWVTADERRIPVMLKSKIAVGSFTAQLVEIESPQAGTPEQDAGTVNVQTQ